MMQFHDGKMLKEAVRIELRNSPFSFCAWRFFLYLVFNFFKQWAPF